MHSTHTSTAGQSTGVDAHTRQLMIAEAAYFRASWRGFDGGDSFADWLDAEREIDERLAGESVDPSPKPAAEIRNFLDSVVDELREQREEIAEFLREDVSETGDDLRELRDRLEEQWDEFKTANAHLQERASEASQELRERARQLADDLRGGYAELRERLKRPATKRSASRRKQAG